MYRKFFLGSLVLGMALFCCAGAGLAEAAEATGGYLSGYAEVDPRPTAVSWWSTIAYLLSLLAVFVFVAGLAYLASRYLSGHFGKALGGMDGRVLSHISLGPNRSVCIVELADHVFVLGVTDHSITMLREITDADEIERLHRRDLGHAGNMEGVFAQQFGSLEQLAQKIPSLFRGSRR